MTTYRLSIWYAAHSDNDEPQVHTGLSADRLEQGVSAFWGDMVALEGKGVRRLQIDVETAEASK
jgi:hypothetical protein